MKTGVSAFLLSVLLLSIAAVSFERERSDAAIPETSVAPELAVVGDASGFPDGCDPITMTYIVLGFFEAYNNGQVERFAEFFPPNFTWYSDTRGDPEKGLHFVVSSREKLLPYFAERHRQHERLSLIALNLIRSETNQPALIHIGFSLYRQADDIEPGSDDGPRLGGGKGALLCSQKKIYVWAMGIMSPAETTPMWSGECEKAFLTPLPQNLTATAETQQRIDSGDLIPPKGLSSATVCVVEN